MVTDLLSAGVNALCYRGCKRCSSGIPDGTVKSTKVRDYMGPVPPWPFVYGGLDINVSMTWFFNSTSLYSQRGFPDEAAGAIVVVESVFLIRESRNAFKNQLL